jgi:hypothetical protein
MKSLQRFSKWNRLMAWVGCAALLSSGCARTVDEPPSAAEHDLPGGDAELTNRLTGELMWIDRLLAQGGEPSESDAARLYEYALLLDAVDPELGGRIHAAAQREADRLGVPLAEALPFLDPVALAEEIPEMGAAAELVLADLGGGAAGSDPAGGPALEQPAWLVPILLYGLITAVGVGTTVIIVRNPPAPPPPVYQHAALLQVGTHDNCPVYQCGTIYNTTPPSVTSLQCLALVNGTQNGQPVVVDAPLNQGQCIRRCDEAGNRFPVGDMVGIQQGCPPTRARRTAVIGD